MGKRCCAAVARRLADARSWRCSPCVSAAGARSFPSPAARLPSGWTAAPWPTACGRCPRRPDRLFQRVWGRRCSWRRWLLDPGRLRPVCQFQQEVVGQPQARHLDVVQANGHARPCGCWMGESPAAAARTRTRPADQAGRAARWCTSRPGHAAAPRTRSWASSRAAARSCARASRPGAAPPDHPAPASGALPSAPG